MKYEGYAIVKAQSIEALEYSINDLLRDGYMPLGGAVIDSSTGLYYQTIVKEIKPKVGRPKKQDDV